MWFEEVKKNPFVVLGVHIFSGVGPRAAFVPLAENKKRVKSECNNSPKVKTNPPMTQWIICLIRGEKTRSCRRRVLNLMYNLVT